MAATAAAGPAAGRSDSNTRRDTRTRRRARKAAVERVLLAVARPPSARRELPPQGRLDPVEDYARGLRVALGELGPVFAEFGVYLSSRLDLVPRRTRAELRGIPDIGVALPVSEMRALIRAELGASVERVFLEFHDAPIAVGRWTERHVAWIAAGVPAIVTLVRPDAGSHLDDDVPLLTLLAPWIDARPDALADAIRDFELGLRRRLDQRHQASVLAALGADARNGGGFDAPACYHDHSSAHVLTCEHIAGETLNECGGAGEALMRRVSAAWLRQAFVGSVVPYDFTAADVLVAGDRLVLTGGALEPHVTIERARFAAYVGAVAADDPNEAAAWIVEGTDLPSSREDELRRQLRQAVPFREGEWSGDERLAEQVLVQWRVAYDAGWPLSWHHQHVYRGLYGLHLLAQALAPGVDTFAGALDDERLRIGASQAADVLDPRQFNAHLERAIKEMVELPHRLDALLSAAADGRLRTKLVVPDSDDTEHVRDRTVLLVTALVAFAALASVLRHLVPALGASADRAGAVLLLALGGWLLIAAARL